MSNFLDREKLPMKEWNQHYEELSDELFKAGGSETKEGCYRVAVNALVLAAKMLHSIDRAEGYNTGARWLEQPNPQRNRFLMSRCSRCGNQEYTLSTEYMPYCPQCGSRMQGIELNRKPK